MSTTPFKLGDYTLDPNWKVANIPDNGKTVVFNPNDTNQRVFLDHGLLGDGSDQDPLKYLAAANNGDISNTVVGWDPYKETFKGPQYTLNQIAEQKRLTQLSGDIQAGKVSADAGTVMANDPNQKATLPRTFPVQEQSTPAPKQNTQTQPIDNSKLANGLPPDDPSNQYNTATGAPNPNYNPAAPKPNSNTTNQTQTSAPTAFFSGANLANGSRGPAVAQLQTALGIKSDGIFGNQTLAAVKKFQVEHNLKSDGIVGPQTMAALNQPSGSPIASAGAGMASTSIPSGWDSQSYANFKSANPGIEPNAQDTAMMQASGNIKKPVDKSPQTIVSEVHQASLKALGTSNIKSEYDNLNKQYETLANKKNDEAQAINNDPWYSEGVRVQKLNQLDSKYEGKELILTNKLKIQEGLYNNALQDAQFMTGQALDIYSQKELFDQQVMLKGLDSAQSQWEAELKLASQSPSDIYGTGSIGEYNFAKSQGYKGTFSQYQTEDSNRKRSITNISVGDKNQAQNASTQTTLSASTGADGYVDPSLYSKLRATSGISATEFDNRFSHFVNPLSTSKLGIGSGTEKTDTLDSLLNKYNIHTTTDLSPDKLKTIPLADLLKIQAAIK